MSVKKEKLNFENLDIISETSKDIFAEVKFNRERRYKIYSILKIIYAKLEFFKKSVEVFVSRKSRRGESRWKFSCVRSCENTGATVVTHNSVIRVTCYRQIALQSLVTFYKYARWLLTLRCVWGQVIETKTCIHFLSIRGANEVGENRVRNLPYIVLLLR